MKESDDVESASLHVKEGIDLDIQDILSLSKINYNLVVQAQISFMACGTS